MADIFHEIDEDLRRERFSRLWSRFGVYLIALAVLIVVAVAGWRGYEWWRVQQEEASGARFENALRLGDEGRHAEAEAAFTAIEADGTSGYRLLSRFRAATELSGTDPTAAVAEFDAIAADGSINPLMRDVARIRAAMLLVDTAPVSEIETRMTPLDTPEGNFRHSARELIGLSQYRAGDAEAAAATFAKIVADGQVPPGLRQRAELIRSMASGGTPSTATSAPATPDTPASESITTDAPAPVPGAPAPSDETSGAVPIDPPVTLPQPTDPSGLPAGDAGSGQGGSVAPEDATSQTAPDTSGAPVAPAQ